MARRRPHCTSTGRKDGSADLPQKKKKEKKKRKKKRNDIKLSVRRVHLDQKERTAWLIGQTEEPLGRREGCREYIQVYTSYYHITKVIYTTYSML